jgi:excinuclease ABC subunit A
MEGRMLEVTRQRRAVQVAADAGSDMVERKRSDGKLIRVRGAKEHNLKNIDVEIPRDQLVVITGLSGSGKSSLAFDTIFAEGQRKYMESLSAYARQFLEQLKKPDVEEIEGIPPTIAIEQRSASANPRSTVATTTEIYDYLRLLFARCGTPYSWAPTKVRKDGTVLERSGKPITATTSTQIVDKVMSWMGSTSLRDVRAGDEREGAEEDTHAAERRATQARIMVLAPVVRGEEGVPSRCAGGTGREGVAAGAGERTIIDLRDALKEPGENPLDLGRFNKHDIDAVIDRIVLKPDVRQRLAESIEAALKLADSAVIVAREGTEARGTRHEGRRGRDAGAGLILRSARSSRTRIIRSMRWRSSARGCSRSTRRTGRARRATGWGRSGDGRVAGAAQRGDEPGEGAIAAWNKNGPVRAWFNRKLRRYCKAVRGELQRAGEVSSPPSSGGSSLRAKPEDVAKYKMKFDGVVPNITQWWGTTENEGVKEWLGTFLSQKPCTMCHGDRLRIEAPARAAGEFHKADTDKRSRKA